MDSKLQTKANRGETMSRAMIFVALTAALTACGPKEVTKTVQAPATANSSSDQRIEGTINGGGGTGVLCEKDGKKTLEVLDLYEGRVLYGLTRRATPIDENDAIKTLATLLANHYAENDFIFSDEAVRASRDKVARDATEKLIRKVVQERMHFVESDKDLKYTQDVSDAIAEQGCKLVQIATYYNESVILVNRRYWSMLDWTGKMAIYAHEPIFRHARSNGAKTSVETRKFVAHLLSAQGVTPIVPQGALPKRIAQCIISKDGSSVGDATVIESTELETPYSDEKEPGLKFYFHGLLDRQIMFRTSAFFRQLTLDQLKDPTKLPTRLEATLAVDTYDSDVIGGNSVEINKKDGLTLRVAKEGRSLSTGQFDDLKMSCHVREQE